MQRALPAILAALLGLAATPAAPADDVAKSAEEIRPILLGTVVPDVAVRNPQGEETSLHAAIGRKPTLLLFYRGGW